MRSPRRPVSRASDVLQSQNMIRKGMPSGHDPIGGYIVAPILPIVVNRFLQIKI